MGLKNKIKQWFFAEEIEILKQFQETQEEMETSIKLMNRICDVGVDVDLHSNEHSWAVVCIHGKIEYVKFIPLNYDNARDVLQFLKRFQYSKYVLDSPLGFKNMVKDHIIRNPFFKE